MKDISLESMVFLTGLFFAFAAVNHFEKMQEEYDDFEKEVLRGMESVKRRKKK